MNNPNYFDFDNAAKRYKKGRPDFHIELIHRLKEIWNIKDKFERTLDVACGTGLLTKALLEISKEVIGIDNSEGMLNNAYLNERITYHKGDAENLEIIEGMVDLVTVSSAFHWLKQKIFLESVKGVLPIGHQLVIHNNFFTSTTDDENSENFKQWVRGTYLEKFKTPKRNKFPLEEGELEEIGFKEILNERFDNTVPMKKERFIDYLITQSNVISNVELGNYTLDNVKAWMSEELDYHFEKDISRNFIFGNRLIILERVF